METLAEFLSGATNGFYLMAMIDQEDVYPVPYAEMEKYWNELGETVRANGSRYKHIVLDKTGDEIFLRVRTKNHMIPLSLFKI